ncbi:aspartyl protease family protein [Flammeovirga sp. SJP92]|uniref:aspartyl protease family protein n=1 Tax=Flammeovirga sp. SJP92 TaxID=1775430 RepID=UPI000798BDED|nr:aspartyl protease family protein [Flammeovirga sp. SJP92]KXX71962.1 hypothetical protein AVL50_04030 [Flammeovirga sp. SJP92]
MLYNKKTILFLLLLLSFFGCNPKLASIINSGKTDDNFRTVIPFETKMGLIIIEAKVKGKPYQFIFDTGAMASIISPEMKNRLGLETLMTEKIYDVDNNYIEQEFTKVEHFEIGNTSFSDIGAIVMDLNAIPTVKCFGVDGLIGSNLFRHATWFIDYERKEIVIANDRSQLKKSTEGFTSVKFFEGFGGVPSLTTYINENKVLNTVIDYGFGGEVQLDEKHVKKVESEKVHKGYGVTSVGLYGEEVPKLSYSGTIKSFSLGNGLDFENQKITFEGKYSNTLGTGIFKYHHIILDWNNKEILFKRNNIPKKIKNELGYALGYRDGAVYIRNVYENSIAMKKGLQLQDKIIAIDGVNFERIDEKKWCEYLINAGNSNTKVLLIERDGVRHEITFEVNS